MEARMKHVITIFPGVLKALQELSSASEKGGVSHRTLAMVHLRASQINGCSVCVATHASELKKMGETDDRLFAVAAWRDARAADRTYRGHKCLESAQRRNKAACGRNRMMTAAAGPVRRNPVTQRSRFEG